MDVLTLDRNEVLRGLLDEFSRTTNPAFRTIPLEIQDMRSPHISSVAVSNIELISFYSSGESCLTHKQRIERLRTLNKIPLDPSFGVYLSQNQRYIPDSWRMKESGLYQDIAFE